MSKVESNELMIVDGSLGEGGGQILRSSLGLAALTGRPVRLVNIRAGRKKPGLLRQHLTAVTAAAEVCEARVEGAELGSLHLTFEPQSIRHGRHSFVVGTAGSATLVLQTVLPILLSTPGRSELEVSGGTHNPLAPPHDFLEHVYFPLLRRMGVRVESELVTAGFYPAGGGHLRVALDVPSRLEGVELLAWNEEPAIEAWAVCSQIPGHVAERELEVIRTELGIPPARTRHVTLRSPGPGNVVCVRVGELELVSAFGERGLRAETVARTAADQVKGYLQARAPVGEHLADQLILPFALCGGAYRSAPLSSHATTNVAVLRQFLGERAVSVHEEANAVRLTFPGRQGT